MLDIQLGRRNLSPIQRIAIAEKYRPIYERQALANKQAAMQEARNNNEKNKLEQISVNLPKTEPINTSEKLANIAGVSEKTYRMGVKVLNSDNEDLKQRILADFSKAERIDYARRLERIESLKAKGRMSDGGKGRQKSDNLRTDDSVAEKLGIGSRDTYRKEKYIVEN